MIVIMIIIEMRAPNWLAGMLHCYTTLATAQIQVQGYIFCMGKVFPVPTHSSLTQIVIMGQQL